jgi:hypothetical protein
MPVDDRNELERRIANLEVLLKMVLAARAARQQCALCWNHRFV